MGKRHLVLVTEIHQRPDRQALRIRPLDIPRLPAFRKLPCHRGGKAGIARVHPIGVPAFANGLVQDHRDRAAWGNACAFRNESCLDLWNLVGQRARLEPPIPEDASPNQTSQARKKQIHSVAMLLGALPEAASLSWVPRRVVMGLPPPRKHASRCRFFEEFPGKIRAMPRVFAVHLRCFCGAFSDSLLLCCPAAVDGVLEMGNSIAARTR